MENDYQYKAGIQVRRNPDYRETDKAGNRFPYVDGVKFVIIGDHAARLAAFRTGKVDTALGFPATPTFMRDLLRVSPTTLIQERTSARTAVDGLSVRLDKEPWNDVRVRQALALAIDYETASQTIYEVPFNGTTTGISSAWYGEPGNTIAKLTKECGCPWYSYDPQRAEALLAEAGYPDGFTMSFEYFPFSQAYGEMFELIGSYWSQIGLDVQQLIPDFSIWRSNIDVGGWTDVSWSYIAPPPGSPSAAVQPVLPGNSGNGNLGRVNDPKLTALAEEFLASYQDSQRQNDLLKEMRSYYLDQVYTLPIPYGHQYTAFAPRLRNYQPSTHPLVGADYRHFIQVWIDDTRSFAN